jgi:hypothetical protein
MTAIGWLIVLALIAFFTLLVLRLLPLYLNNYKIVGSLESLKEEPYLTQKPMTEIQQLLLRRFDINSVDHVTKDNIAIQNKQGRLTVRVKYEVRTPILGNIDAVASFDDGIELVSQ